MRFSLVEGEKTAPSPTLKGVCSFCGAATVAKCGSIIKWHWAHKNKCICDPWWENETQWHRDWKNHWADENQEIVHFDNDNEKHIADVVNDQGVVIEIQNSPMSIDELKSREHFYGDMVWIVNGEIFGRNMKLGAMLPDPKNSASKEIVVQSTNHKTHFLYYYFSDYRGPNELVEMHSSEKIKGLTNNTHVGHFLFEWKRPRHVWFISTKSVYFDFGKDVLWQLMRFNKHSCFCLKACLKDDFIEEFGGVP